MSQRLNTIPKDDGFIMPGEHEKHNACWMIWPERCDNWRQGAKPAQSAYTQVANTIAKYESVNMLVSAKQYETARFYLDQRIKVIEMSSNDAWMRDVGPTFIRNSKTKEIRAIDWIFNSWGGLQEGIYFPWDQDNKIAQKVAELIGYDYYQAPFVLEGGSIHSDGDGTVYTTEECLLNKNRNPNLSKVKIENYLKVYLGAIKVIWLPYGVYNDETNGHIDNILHVVKPGHVILTWTDNQNDPQYERSLKAWEVLVNTVDAKKRKIKVTKLHQPEPLFYSKEEVQTIDPNDGKVRVTGARLPASYVNFYIANGAVILPIFNDKKWDKNAIKILKKIYHNHKIEPIYAREILLGGGNIHCITQQEISF